MYIARRGEMFVQLHVHLFDLMLILRFSIKSERGLAAAVRFLHHKMMDFLHVIMSDPLRQLCGARTSHIFWPQIVLRRHSNTMTTYV